MLGTLGLLCLFAAAVTLAALAESRHADAVAREARAIDNHANRLLIDLLNAETGQRGYLLTADPRYLQPYRLAVAAVTGDLFALNDATQAPGMNAGELTRIRALAREKVTELARTVTLERAGHREQALAIVRTNEGKQLMDAERAGLTAIKASADRLAAAPRKSASDALRRAFVLDVVLLLLVVVLAIWWRARGTRAAAERDRAVEELAGEARLERALREVAAAATGDVAEPELAGLVAARLGELLNATTAAVIRAEPDSLHIIGYHGPRPFPDRIPWDEPSSSARAARAGVMARLEDYGPPSGTVGGFVHAQGLRCGISVPVRRQRQVWGCITVTTRESTFTARQEEWLERFADLTSAALSNAAAQTQLRFRARLEEALRDVAVASASGNLGERELAALVAGWVAELLDAPSASVVRFGTGDAILLGSAGPAALPLDERIDERSATGQVAASGATVVVDDFTAFAGVYQELLRDHESSAAVAVPVWLGESLWGTLGAMLGPHAETSRAVELLERFAAMVSAALANAEAQIQLREQAAALASLHDGLAVLDGDGRLVDVNEPFCRMTGYTREQLIGSVPPYPFSLAQESDPFALTRPATPVQRDLHRCDGGVVTVAASVNEVSSTDGRTGGRVAVLTDISETVFAARLEAALGEVATACAQAEDDARPVFDLVAERVSGLLGGAAAAVVSFDGRRGVIVGKHGAIIPDEQSLDEPGAASLVAATGRAARIDDYAAETGAFAQTMASTGLRCAVAVPVRLRSLLWGCVALISDQPGGLPPETERLLERFAALVAVAHAQADTLAELHRQADTDGLTGLLNHRAFQERLQEERRRAQRHRRPLALCMFDLDGFKLVNDTHGHQTGDRVLRSVAEALVACRRAGDVLARIGGDEFAVIAPDTNADDALALAERVRAASSEAVASLGLTVTVSAGVTDLGAASTTDDLVHLADTALYHAKHHGRDQTVRYAPGAEEDASEEDGHQRAERARALSGLSALIRAVDAKDTSTEDHARRVAHVAVQLAVRLGWSPERCVRLHEAALLHDIGKVGVPESILASPGELSPEELEQVKSHAILGAQIAQDVLDDEQVRWVRSHHERLDGQGYPDALCGTDIPQGALVLAVADAFDALTSTRAYRGALAPADAIREMRAAAGTQFDPDLLDLLEDWALYTKEHGEAA